MATTTTNISMPTITAVPHGGIPSADHMANVALHPTAPSALPLASALAPIFDSPAFQSLEAAQGLDDPALPGTKIGSWYSVISDVLAAEPTDLQSDEVKEDVKLFLSEYFSVAGWKYPEAGRVATKTGAAEAIETVVTEVLTTGTRTITVQRLAPVTILSTGLQTETTGRLVEFSQTAMSEDAATVSAQTTQPSATPTKTTTSSAVTTGALAGVVTDVVETNAAGGQRVVKNEQALTGVKLALVGYLILRSLSGKAELSELIFVSFLLAGLSIIPAFR